MISTLSGVVRGPESPKPTGIRPLFLLEVLVVLDAAGVEMCRVEQGTFEVSPIGVLTVWGRDYAYDRGRQVPVLCAAPGQWALVKTVEGMPKAAPIAPAEPK